jgi:hypothetical protein
MGAPERHAGMPPGSRSYARNKTETSGHAPFGGFPTSAEFKSLVHAIAGAPLGIAEHFQKPEKQCLRTRGTENQATKPTKWLSRAFRREEGGKMDREMLG